MQYNQVEANINFRTVKSETVNPETGEKVKTETKRDQIKLHVPVPAWEEIIAMIEAGTAADATEIAKNNLQLVQDALFAVVYEQAVSLAKDNADLTSANFPLSELDWEKIANAPEAERKSRGISKDEWADFAEDYVTSMVAITGKDEKRVANAAAAFIDKFAKVKSDKKIIAVLRDNLVVYAEQGPNASQNYKVIDFLLKKADALLAAEITSADDF